MSNVFDFQSSTTPTLSPLRKSFAVDDFEAEIKDLFISLFTEKLGEDAFDVLNAGLPHLGTFGSVQKEINADGLSLLRGSGEQAATRYLYRSWTSGDVQKRGLFLLRIYVKLLFGSLAKVAQLQQDKAKPYATDLIEYEPGRGILDNHFLTSRVFVDIDSSLANESVKNISSSIQSVLAARFVPEIRFITLTTISKTTLKFANNVGLTAHVYATGTLR